MPDLPVPRPLLLVFAHGTGAAELADMRRTSGLELPPAAPLSLPRHPVDAALRDLDGTNELHDLGVGVDRSGLLLRPTGRTDATVVETIARRASGPAPVTLFEATGVLTQAMIGGAHAAAAAANTLGLLLAKLQGILRRGDLPEVWFVGLGAARPVQRTFDFVRAFRRALPPPLAFDLALHVAPGTATITGDNQRALDIAARRLQAGAFARHGTLAPAPTGRLHFVANPNVAFGAHRLAARAPHAHEADAFHAAPVGDSVRARGLPFAELLARFWMRAATLHAPLDVPTPAVPEPTVRAAANATATMDPAR